jgi:hypothetical protein
MFSLPAVILNKYSHFDTPTGVRPGGRPAGTKRDIKANSAKLKLELGLSLAISKTGLLTVVICRSIQVPSK